MSGRFLVLLIVVALAIGGGTTAFSGGADPVSAGTGRVVRVVDGDTIHVMLPSGVKEKVRYIGVDTPESVHPSKPVQCYAKAASARNAELVADEEVRLETDAEERDRYGRLLAYVYRERDGLFVNEALVREGYATPLTIPPNVAHAEDFRDLAASAREADRGLWRACS
ncbi:MAG: thermonuclease family protein [Solirubrobacteraceae bacterium]|nr:thermonuclease family protein [Solirubrobacteraceae bacterium]